LSSYPVPHRAVAIIVVVVVSHCAAAIIVNFVARRAIAIVFVVAIIVNFVAMGRGAAVGFLATDVMAGAGG
jgi:hypothetical protein